MSLFYPTPYFSPPPPGARDLFVPVAPGVRLHARAYDSPEAKVNVIGFHGNGEVVSHYDDQAPAWAAIGACFAVIDYRGYGRSEGRPDTLNLVTDAVAAFTAVWEALPPRPTFAFGRSLGSVPLAEVACAFDRRLAGVILDSGAPRIPSAPELRPVEKLSRGSAPLLILHGADDQLLSPDGAREIHDRSVATDKTLVLLPGRGHNNVASSMDYWRAVRGFLAEHRY